MSDTRNPDCAHLEPVGALRRRSCASSLVLRLAGLTVQVGEVALRSEGALQFGADLQSLVYYSFFVRPGSSLKSMPAVAITLPPESWIGTVTSNSVFSCST